MTRTPCKQHGSLNLCKKQSECLELITNNYTANNCVYFLKISIQTDFKFLVLLFFDAAVFTFSRYTLFQECRTIDEMRLMYYLIILRRKLVGPLNNDYLKSTHLYLYSVCYSQQSSLGALQKPRG